MMILTRDNKWLHQRFAMIWKRHFSDVEIKNKISIKFGRPCRTRLGSIKPGVRCKLGRQKWVASATGNPEFTEGCSSKVHIFCQQACNKYSCITINGYFQDPEIPEFVVDAIIAHEFMHYAHGFASPHQQAYRHPHKGGVVTWDLKERGLGDILKLEKSWIKKNWKNYLINHGGLKLHTRKIRRKRYFKFKFF